MITTAAISCLDVIVASVTYQGLDQKKGSYYGRPRILDIIAIRNGR